MMDGDVDYTVTISGSGAAAQYNIAYIIDVSGSMRGQNILDARNAYIELTNQLKKLGIADVANFAVIPFNGSSTLYSDLSADQAISRISALNAGGSTYFGPPIRDAQSFFLVPKMVRATSPTSCRMDKALVPQPLFHRSRMCRHSGSVVVPI